MGREFGTDFTNSQPLTQWQLLDISGNAVAAGECGNEKGVTNQAREEWSVFPCFFQVARAILGVRYLSTALACGEAAFLGPRGWRARNSKGGSATWESGTEVPHSKEKQAELGWLHPFQKGFITRSDDGDIGLRQGDRVAKTWLWMSG